VHQLIGRQALLSSLASSLECGARLITLQGPGGVGKTRLAEALAASRPAVLCRLQAHRTERALVGAVARALGVVLRGGSPVDEVGDRLAARGPTLLVLDNLEQLVEPARPVLRGWLAAAPRLQLVVTSQRRLGLMAEQVLLIPPLDTDSGVALFHQRAAALGAQADDPAVPALVEALDGLPLAIELAAGRCRLLSPSRMLERLSERFRLLAGRVDGDPRHATLQAALAWTWELLQPTQQDVLSQLARFQGRFSLEDAEAVVSVPDAYLPDVLASLLDHSLIQGEGALWLLDAVSAFAGERCADPAGLARRHAAWAAQLGRASRPESSIAARHPDAPEKLADVSLALSWALSERSPLAAPCALAQADLRALLGTRAGTDARLRAALAVPGVPAAEQIALRLRLASTLSTAGRLEASRAVLDAIATGPEQVDPVTWGAVCLRHATRAWFSGHLDEAAAHCRAGLAPLPCTEQMGMLRGRLLGSLANLTNLRGSPDGARTLYHQALQEPIDDSERAILTANLGLLAMDQGWLEEAWDRLRDALQQATALRMRPLEATVQGNLGICRSLMGDSAAAISLLESAMATSRDLGDARSVRYQRNSLAELALQSGDLAGARQHIDRISADASAEPIIRALNAALQAELAARAGESVAAGAAMASALEQAAALGNPHAHATVLAQCAWLRSAGLLGGDPIEPLAEAERLAAEMKVGPRSGLGQAIARARPAGLQIAPDGAWVRLSEGEQIDLGRRGLLRRLITALRDHAPASTEQLLDAGWPGSPVAPDQLARRLYSALHELRRLGVPITRSDDGYALDGYKPLPGRTQAAPA